MIKETDIWKLYRRGCDYFNRVGAYSEAEEAHRFYEGDQWYGLESGGERLPVYNIIAPLVRYKVAMVADKRVCVTFNPVESADSRALKMCKDIEKEIRKCFEHISFDKRQWEIVQSACIGGTAFAYFYKGKKHIEADLLDSTAVMLANEEEPETELQDYILIVSRRPVEQVKKEARANGVSEEKAAEIISDTEGGLRPEVESDGGRCLCVMKLWKKDGCVHFAKATRTCVYCPETAVKGLHMYPVAKLCWEKRHGSARGRGEVTPLIANQIEINKSMARMSVALKNSAYPKLAYLAGSVTNPSDLDKVGVPIEVMGGAVSDLNSVLRYLQPGQVNSLALGFTESVIQKTKDLSGQGEAVTGTVNPENASGAAILAAQDAAAIYLNAPTAAFVDFVERVSRILADMLCAYGKGKTGDFSLLEYSVAVDITRCDAYSKFAGEKNLSALLSAGCISFEEYVNSLDDDSSVPKAKLLKILSERGVAK